MQFSLPERLKTATRELHTEAERAGVMRRLVTGRLPRADYLRLMHNLAAIYDALEPALARHAAHPALAPVYDPALARRAALAADLALLAPQAKPPPLAPSTAAYVARLHRLDRSAPQQLLAHAYVRYLGDLSGGQVLQRVVGHSYGLTPPDGLRFYLFGDSAEVAARIGAFRRGLAAVPVSADDIDALVDEARAAFTLHAAMFRELDAPAADAAVQAPSSS